MIRTMSRLPIAAAILTISLSFTHEAKAGLLPTAVSQSADGNNTRYSYGVVLTSDSTLKTGDYFTIYDFAGAINETNLQPAGFKFSIQNVGNTPSGIAPTDNPNVANVTWTYTGSGTIAGPTNLGSFSVDSPISTTSDGVFTSQTHRLSDGKIDANITEAQIPIPGIVPASVPEPASLALAAIGLPLIGLFRRLRRRS